MARQKFEKSFNTFIKGLMTEASEINFPENYSLYEKNFELRRDGGRDRRRGMEPVFPLGVYLTSRPYVVESLESLSLAGSTENVDNRVVLWRTGMEDDPVSVGAAAEQVLFRSVIYDMDGGIEEAVIGGAAESLTFRGVLVVEDLGIDNASVAATGESIYLEKTVVPYGNGLPEELSLGAEVEELNFYTNNPILSAPYNLSGVFIGG